MSHIVSEIAKYLPKSDIEIIETHHNRKVDAPSGTALVLADAINKTLNNEKYYEYNRHDKREKRNPKEIGIHSIRGGNIVGEHTVSFFTETECFKLTHTAQSRGVFADGSLKAAEFLVVQDPGFIIWITFFQNNKTTKKDRILKFYLFLLFIKHIIVNNFPVFLEFIIIRRFCIIYFICITFFVFIIQVRNNWYFFS